MASAPIGIIDSGLGGLAVARKVWSELPKESTIYFADHAFFPYGNKSIKELNERLVVITNYLLGKKIKALVVACNTATVNTIKFLRQIYTLPIVGTEPAVKSALKEHHQEKIVVLATPGTATNSFYGSTDVSVIPCPGLAESIESKAKKPIELEQAIKIAIKAIKKPYTAVVLGCTHYLLVKDLFEKLVPSGVEVFDPSAAIARRVRSVLEEKNILNRELQPKRQFLTTGDSKIATDKATALLKQDIIFSPCGL